MAELIRELRVDPALDLLRLVCFAVLIGLGLLVVVSGRHSAPRYRRAVSVLVGYVLVISFAVGLTQVESWPFTTWALVHHLAPAEMRSWELEGLTRDGRGHPVDPRILGPLSPEEFGAGPLARLLRLEPAAQLRVGRFLLARAEAARQRVVAGGPVAPSERILGPLAAPYHFHTRRVWRGASDVPTTPFVGLRIWLLEWEVEARLADERLVRRRLLGEFGAGPPS